MLVVVFVKIFGEESLAALGVASNASPGVADAPFVSEGSSLCPMAHRAGKGWSH